MFQASMPLLAEAIVGFFLAVLEVFQDDVEDNNSNSNNNSSSNEVLPGDELLDPEAERLASVKFDER
jgi:mannose/fructose/N-acetylgalactosamine-specific phosphotransferase system component IIC